MIHENGSHISPVRTPTESGSEVGSIMKKGMAMAKTSHDISTVEKNSPSNSLL